MESVHLQSLLLICGDFNHPSLCSGENKTLDLLYANVKDAYTSAPLPRLGCSDHNLVHLLNEYTPRVRGLPAQKSVKMWTDEASERLRDSFQTTD